jgi:hypothetical protein
VGVGGNVRVDATFAVDVGVRVARLLFFSYSILSLLRSSRSFCSLLPAFAVVYVLESDP